jgi:transcriptional regulator with XRE-family HTH domain
MTNTTFGERIKSRRLQLRLSQAKLATLSGLAQSTISDLERGMHQGTTNVASLAAALKVSALWLETGRGTNALVATEQQPALPELPEELLDLIDLFNGLRPDQIQSYMEQIRRTVLDNRLTLQAFASTPERRRDHHRTVIYPQDRPITFRASDPAEGPRSYFGQGPNGRESRVWADRPQSFISQMRTYWRSQNHPDPQEGDQPERRRADQTERRAEPPPSNRRRDDNTSGS